MNEVRPWIAIAESHPAETDIVLVSDGFEVNAALYRRETATFYHVDEDCLFAPVYWMELPAGPEARR